MHGGEVPRIAKDRVARLETDPDILVGADHHRFGVTVIADPRRRRKSGEGSEPDLIGDPRPLHVEAEIIAVVGQRGEVIPFDPQCRIAAEIGMVAGQLPAPEKMKAPDGATPGMVGIDLDRA